MKDTSKSYLNERAIVNLTELLRRTEAAQCLQSRHCLRRRGLVADAGRESDFQFFEISNWAHPAGLHWRTDQLTPINTWLLLAKLIAESQGFQRALTLGPILCLFCDR